MVCVRVVRDVLCCVFRGELLVDFECLSCHVMLRLRVEPCSVMSVIKTVFMTSIVFLYLWYVCAGMCMKVQERYTCMYVCMKVPRDTHTHTHTWRKRIINVP